ncbi:hypothetical protein [Lacisediminihabitans changchengi]|uniref:Uncharacterized protein n=1 Tax=Lacisediminihabitans changchengi TaxID=2787634 RepID=A0A934SQP6_9MICO|nr:hypothetical protein [Lacisediminihabitans changchengi]MBK4347240.1 hypothetical protein [Lacisediminihabitans changchengi]
MTNIFGNAESIFYPADPAIGGSAFHQVTLSADEVDIFLDNSEGAAGTWTVSTTRLEGLTPTKLRNLAERLATAATVCERLSGVSRSNAEDGLDQIRDLIAELNTDAIEVAAEHRVDRVDVELNEDGAAVAVHWVGASSDEDRMLEDIATAVESAEFVEAHG